jgi:mono/diheme cytochrome c family protein
MTHRYALAALAFAALSTFALPATAQDAKPADNDPGKALVSKNCFQCHTDTMFRDQRQDHKAWEATIYRMIGRGALWSADERKTMADYLAVAYGPTVKPAWEQAKTESKKSDDE